MTGSRIVLVDSDEHTAGQLVAELARRGFDPVTVATTPSALPALLSGGATDVVSSSTRPRSAR